MKVQLTELEKRLGTVVGTVRFSRAVNEKLQDRIGMDESKNQQHHIDGAQAELAFCKLTGFFWDTDINIFKGADVGTHIQIRSTQYQTGKLCIYDEDNDQDLYVLAIHGEGIDFRGTIIGAKAKQSKYFKSEINGKRLLKACYVLNQDELIPFTLSDLVRIKLQLRNGL